MNSLLTLAKDLEQKSKAQQQSTGEMLKAAFSEHEKSVRAELSESEKRISAAILDHDRKLSSAMSQRTKGMVRMVSQTWLTIVLVSALLTASGASILWWQGQQILTITRPSGSRSARRPCCPRGTAACSSRPAESRDAAA